MTVYVESLRFYPVKGCRSITCESARLLSSGFEHDREWMLIDSTGVFVSQRTAPRLALVTAELASDSLSIHAPGRPMLILSRRRRTKSLAVRVWTHQCQAEDMGDAAAQWFTVLLDKPVRLVRFATDGQRYSDPRFTGPVQAPVMFADAYAVLATSTTSLAALNENLVAALPMDRFRPNLVMHGLPPYAEDAIDSLRVGAVELRLVKRCTRCVVTTVDQATAAVGVEPLPTLKRLRWDKELHGVTFGVNAIVIRPGTIRVRDRVEVKWKAAASSSTLRSDEGIPNL